MFKDRKMLMVEQLLKCNEHILCCDADYYESKIANLFLDSDIDNLKIQIKEEIKEIVLNQGDKIDDEIVDEIYNIFYYNKKMFYGQENNANVVYVIYSFITSIKIVIDSINIVKLSIFDIIMYVLFLLLAISYCKEIRVNIKLIASIKSFLINNRKYFASCNTLVMLLCPWLGLTIHNNVITIVMTIYIYLVHLLVIFKKI